MADKIGKNDDAWEQILSSYPVEQKVNEYGYYEIEASEIKKFREPRLMTKFDTSESVAAPLKRLNLNVLPNSRHSYVIGKFCLYEKFPDVSALRPETIKLPQFETLKVNNLTSEANAINALLASNTLERFLNEENSNLTETFNGRMGTGAFGFNVASFGDSPDARGIQVYVDNAQLEIDGGFESLKSVSIMEAKNIRHDDFNIRQLYFPYRKYVELVTKPIRLIFSQYTNLTYYLYEYEFVDQKNMSSIYLKDMKMYTFEDAKITKDDLYKTLQNTAVTTDDNMDNANVPFIQADRFDRIISIIERINSQSDKTIDTSEVTEFLGVVQRQASYYPAAAEYLGLVERDRGKITLTQRSQDILTLDYKYRQLAYVSLILQHQIFHEVFQETLSSGIIPSKEKIMDIMLRLHVCNSGSTLGRRSQSVIAWINWILQLAE